MRQDRKDLSGVSITARLVADLIEQSGIQTVMVCDLHAEQEQGFFSIPVDELYGSSVLIPDLVENNNKKRQRFASVDQGTGARTLSWSRRVLNHENIITFQKQRDKLTGKTRIIGCQGKISGHHVIFPDDLYASGKTLDDCALYSKKRGASTTRGVVVHGLFLGREGKTAIEILDESPLDEIITTDTVDIPEEIRSHPKVRVVSIAPLLAEAIYRNLTSQSLRDLVE
jgi:ribose-phosphate pyrophosphokinase